MNKWSKWKHPKLLLCRKGTIYPQCAQTLHNVMNHVIPWSITKILQISWSCKDCSKYAASINIIPINTFYSHNVKKLNERLQGPKLWNCLANEFSLLTTYHLIHIQTWTLIFPIQLIACDKLHLHQNNHYRTCKRSQQIDVILCNTM